MNEMGGVLEEVVWCALGPSGRLRDSLPSLTTSLSHPV